MSQFGGLLGSLSSLLQNVHPAVRAAATVAGSTMVGSALLGELGVAVGPLASLYLVYGQETVALWLQQIGAFLTRISDGTGMFPNAIRLALGAAGAIYAQVNDLRSSVLLLGLAVAIIEVLRLVLPSEHFDELPWSPLLNYLPSLSSMSHSVSGTAVFAAVHAGVSQPDSLIDQLEDLLHQVNDAAPVQNMRFE